MKLLKSLIKNPLWIRNYPRTKYRKPKTKFRGQKHIACRNEDCKYQKKIVKKRRSEFPISCTFAHHRNELDHFYLTDPKFRESPCRLMKNCKQIDCRFYHSESETRAYKIKENLFKLQEATFNDINHLSVQSKKGISFNSILPILSRLDGELVKQIAQTALDCLLRFEKESIYDLPQNKQWHQITLNLLEKKCKIVKGRQEGFVEIWKNVSIVNYKSFLFAYNRNSLRNQLSFNIRTAQVVPFVCSDIEKRQASHLKLRIKSLQNKWDCFTDIFTAIHKTKESIYKLDLDICEFIGPIDIDQIEEQFMLVFSDLPNIKVFKLRLEFDFLDGSSYERDIVDVVFDSLEPYKKQIISGEIELHLNIFGMILKRKKAGVYFEAEYIDPHNQKALVRRLKNSKIHKYFIDQFKRRYITSKNIKEFYVDYSNLFGYSKEVGEREKIRKAYYFEISTILEKLQQALNQISSQYLDKAIIKFYQFEFTFENVNQGRSSIYTFNYGLRLFRQNRPFLNFEEANTFGQILKSKLRIQNSNGVYSGNFFRERKKKTLTQFQKRKLLSVEPEPHQINIRPTFNKAIKFAEIMFDRYENIQSFYYFKPDRDAVYPIIKERQRIVDARQISEKQSKFLSKDMTKYKTVRFEQILLTYNLIRRRLVATLAAMKQVNSRNPTFKLRQEVLIEIFKLQKIYPDQNLKLIYKSY